jgi:GDPmannose 4,6-dehydratase
MPQTASCSITKAPRRGETFVTRKITKAVARIKLGLDQSLYLGNLDARRDWGYAPEYVEAVWRMLQADNPDHYVLATNETHTVQEFVEKAFAHVDLDWKEYVRHDKRYERPAEVNLLIGNPAKAKKKLGWEPKVRFEELIQIMVDGDLAVARGSIGKMPLVSVPVPVGVDFDRFVERFLIRPTSNGN